MPSARSAIINCYSCASPQISRKLLLVRRIREFPMRWARAMHADTAMATTAQYPDIHTMAGARWLAYFSPIVLGTLIAALVMFLYPYVTR